MVQIQYFQIYKKTVCKMNGQIKVEETSKHPKRAKKSKKQSSQSEEFQLEYHQIKKLGLQINKKKLKIGNWMPEQNLIYLKFLEQNKLDFISEQQRRKNKVFYRLSKILKKRTPDQCRSHHQKLQMKYEDNTQEIILSIKKKLSKKSPQMLKEQSKKDNISIKKARVTEIVEYKQQGPIISEEVPLYKITRNGQNHLSIHITQDYIEHWS